MLFLFGGGSIFKANRWIDSLQAASLYLLANNSQQIYSVLWRDWLSFSKWKAGEESVRHPLISSSLSLSFCLFTGVVIAFTLDMSTTSLFLPFALASFKRHSLIAAVSVAESIISELIFPTSLVESSQSTDLEIFVLCLPFQLPSLSHS